MKKLNHKKMKIVYIASPYTLGGHLSNVRRQIDAAETLMQVGLCPILPLLKHFQNEIHPRPYEDWMQMDLCTLRVCDFVLRLKGKSKGADREVAYARKIGIPVFESIEELVNCEKEKKKSTKFFSTANWQIPAGR